MGEARAISVSLVVTVLKQSADARGSISANRLTAMVMLEVDMEGLVATSGSSKTTLGGSGSHFGVSSGFRKPSKGPSQGHV